MKSIISSAAVLLVLASGYAVRDGGETVGALKRPTNEAVQEALSTRVAVLIRTETHDYAAVVAAIEAAGGSVTRQFEFARGLAATVPARAISRLRRVDGVLGVGPDEVRRLASVSADDYDRATKSLRLASPPPRIVPMGGDISSINELDKLIAQGVAFDLESKFDLGEKFTFSPDQLRTLTNEMTPDQYANPIAQNAIPVWQSGNFGQGTTVAVIDSGIYADHFLLTGRVVGCVDISEDVGSADEGCSRPGNNYHGTHVASTVAGNGAVLVPADHPIAKAISRHLAPLTNASSLGFPGGRILPLNGIAPLANLYGVKVFPASGAGAPTSTIIAGIEHVIAQKVAGTDIDVINMSLGGGTTYDGRTLEDQAVDAATAAGITVVTAAGNEGPAAQTAGSPASAQSAIAVAAIADPMHMRTFWDFNFFPSNSGKQLFVSDVPQIAYFSSRGGTADGRAKPQISAPGTFILAALISEEDPDGVGFSSGTSMATPGIAGTIALLNTASDLNGLNASPYDNLQALQAGAVPLPGFGEFEQGAGANDAAAAVQALLADNNLGEAFPALPAASPDAPVMPAGIDLGIENGGSSTISVSNLQPGMSQHYYVRTDRNTNLIAVDASNVRTRRDPFGINSFEVYVKTGTRTFLDYYAESINVFGDARIEVRDRSTSVSGAVTGVIAEDAVIQPGYTRITIENDWTSSGPISGTFEVTVEANGNEPAPISVPGAIMTGDTQVLGVAPCPGLACRIDLTWENDWTRYPTTDLDLVLFGLDAGGSAIVLDVGGASLRSPESNNVPFLLVGEDEDVPAVQSVAILVDGFDTNGVLEDYVVDYWPAD